MGLPIDADAEPIGHRPPYRRTDPRYPDRAPIATREELSARIANGAKLADLEAIYRYDADAELYYLKEEFL